MSRARKLGVAGAFVLGTIAGPAGAQSGQDVATAQALFDEGKRLMADKQFAEACPKLVESQRLDPGGGTLLAIALCHEGEGKTATAWAEFGLALTEARKDKRPEREAAASEHIKALEPKLTRVRISPKAPAPNLEIRRDGSLVGEAQWKVALPIDPGKHTFEATAPGKTAWTSTVDVVGEGKTVDVEVPQLDDAAPATPPAPPPKPAEPPAAPKDPPKDAPPADAELGSAQRTWAIVAGGVGVAATAVGLGFGLSASSKWSDVDQACPENRCTERAAMTQGEDAGTHADISTVLVGVGAAAIVAGVVLYLTAPRAERPRSAFVVDRRGVRF